jgi:hypothetical protein
MSIIDNLKKAVDTVTSGKGVDLLISRVSTDEREARLAICHDCEFYLQATTQCKKCGCFVPMKSWLKKSECPMNKW